MTERMNVNAVMQAVNGNYGQAGYGRRRPARSKGRRGRGFFGDLWSGIKKVGSWVKDNKIISKVASAIPHPAAQRVGAVASTLGLGRKRRRVRRGRRRGGNRFVAGLKKIHDYVKKHQLASTIASKLGYHRAAAVAKSLGYGKKRKARRVRKSRYHRRR